MLTRRHWLSWVATLAARQARGQDLPLSVREITLAGAGTFGQKCLVMRPSRVRPDEPLPLLVLFHGLGETRSEAIGIRAFYHSYGLPQAYARLVAPPVRRTLPAERYLSDARLEEINRELAHAPLGDVAIVCPFTPNVFKANPSAPLLDHYAEYVERVALPAARAASATLPGAGHLGVDGVSLGGLVALEVFLRKSELFGVVGSVQGAFGLAFADVYARRINEAISRVGPRRFHFMTSSYDPFRDAAIRLAACLEARKIPVTLTLAEGPHDQRFLREVGTLEMLLYQARALRAP